MQGRGFTGVLLWGALVCGCADPGLDVPRQPAPVSVQFEPAAAPNALPAAFRARLVGAAGASAWLFRGDLSEHYARAVRLGELPSGLLERAVPLRFWSDEQGELVQPLSWLDEGQRYTLALVGVGVVQVWDIAADATPRAERLFPAPGHAIHRVAVHCSESFGEAPPTLLLEPESIPVRASVESSEISACVTFVAEREPSVASVLPPLWASTLLTPGAFAPLPPTATARTVACPAGRLLLGACLEVLDDRVLVTTPEDTLWQLAAPAARVVATSAHERALLVAGLAPGQQVELRGSLLSADASSQELELSVTTPGALRHLVLSEVLANPLGPEPASEWVELVNDSAAAVSLSKLWLEDSGGRSFLPELALAPHETVLLVGAGFRPSSLDVPPGRDVRLLELSSLGLRGLANSGEALLLVGPEGVLSRFPAFAAAHAGRSVARRSFAATDDDPAAFAEHAAPGASPGAANVFD